MASMKKCSHCGKLIYTPYHITDISKDTSVSTYDLCRKCGKVMVGVLEKVDLNHIKTPEQLLQFISEVAHKPQEVKPPCPGCNLTYQEFDKYGRFGCNKCYEHFKDKLEKLVFPYHKASEHTGKLPRKQLLDKCNSTPEEKLKLLKLQLAKAVELEEFDKAHQIRNEIRLLESSSEDQ